ncbi:hypothetical protein [Kitasatospora sp. GAS204B]|uniref:hypothetical protein n=1 Tax=unclassified Kitasatospora TaxID=2633591 RepID=UPI002476A16D|nr:hypothetical protein [Kitasatospora sp. GAS204B]MDH6117414.1 hypothetical protein [Kitasatospora sp. GAS204B]
MSIDFFGAAGGAPDGPDGPPKCSAKGCKAAAEWVLVWNNPKLHTPDRRKTWLACGEHREHLSQFLSVRGFLRETVALADRPQQQARDQAQDQDES